MNWESLVVYRPRPSGLMLPMHFVEYAGLGIPLWPGQSLMAAMLGPLAPGTTSLHGTIIEWTYELPPCRPGFVFYRT